MLLRVAHIRIGTIEFLLLVATQLVHRTFAEEMTTTMMNPTEPVTSPNIMLLPRPQEPTIELLPSSQQPTIKLLPNPEQPNIMSPPRPRQPNIVPRPSHQKPNIIFVMADDLGYADVDWHDTSLQTPNLRWLALHGQHTVQLHQAYVNQLCTPTRSALFTGYYPFRTGTQSKVFLHMEPSAVSLKYPFLSEQLRQLGYATHMIGKWHLGYCRREYLPTSRGFDSFYGFYGAQGGYFNHTAFVSYGGQSVTGFDWFRESPQQPGNSQPDWTQYGRYSTELFADEAVALLHNHNQNRQPLFLYLAFQSVHSPLEVPARYELACSSIANPNRRIYCGMLYAMDEAIGRLLQALHTTGLYNNTVIIFSSDNGGNSLYGASNYPYRGGKDSLFEGGCRTISFVHSPRIVRQPNDPPMNQLFHVVDWFPTIMAIAGANISVYGDGINQWPLITTGKARLIRKQFIYNIDEFGSAIRYDQYKLIVRKIEGRPQNPDVKLYDLAGKHSGMTNIIRLLADPFEMRDLYRTSPRLVRYMWQRLFTASQNLAPSVHQQLSLRGHPYYHNGTFASGFC